MRVLVLVACGFAMVLGQFNHATDSFAYQGCSECRCGDDANAIKTLDESVCNYACDGDAAHGICGSICPAEGPGIASVYTKTDAVSQESQVPTWQTTPTPEPSVVSAASEPLTFSEESSGTEAQETGGLISAAGPAPEVPSFRIVDHSTATTRRSYYAMPNRGHLQFGRVACGDSSTDDGNLQRRRSDSSTDDGNLQRRRSDSSTDHGNLQRNPSWFYHEH
ncbi:hypothetical protein E4U41_004035 [Claviceps citrina]|nr:hypothetical protein E4U41_004035 [Claviceps citrina]